MSGRYTRIAWIGLLIVLILATACGTNPDTGLPENSNSPPEEPLEPEVEVNISDELQIEIVDDPVVQELCMTTGLKNYELEMIFPRQFDIVDPSQPITIEWALDCLPYSQTVVLAEHVRYIMAEGGAQDTLIGDVDVPRDAGEYPYPELLKPATVYTVGVLAYSWDDDFKLTEGSMAFITGPICEPEDLVAPTLRIPIDGGPPPYYKTIEEGIRGVEVEFSYPFEGCIPDGFDVQMSPDPNFNTQDWFGSFDWKIPFYQFSEDNAKVINGISIDLEDCTHYYWNARAKVNEVEGPVSETFSFRTDFEEICPSERTYEGRIAANCRRNPWINDNEVSVLRKGEKADLLGRDDEGWWGKFKLESNGLECWVHMSTVISYLSPILNHMNFPILAHDSEPEPEQSEEGDGGGAYSRQPVTACMIPDYSDPKLVTWSCVSHCPDPKYASRTCKP